MLKKPLYIPILHVYVKFPSFSGVNSKTSVPVWGSTFEILKSGIVKAREQPATELVMRVNLTGTPALSLLIFDI